MGQPLMIFKLSLCDNELQGMEVPDVAFFFLLSVELLGLVFPFYTHTLTHLSRPSFLFGCFFVLFCFCMSGFHHPSMMLLRLEKQGDARRKPERKRVFFGGYFSTLTWMYIYSLRVYLSLRWPTRIVFYTVCDNHWAHAILQCCWHDVKSTLDLTLPDVVARAAFVHHWAKNLALYCDVTLQITCSGLWSVIVYKLFLWYY